MSATPAYHQTGYVDKYMGYQPTMAPRMRGVGEEGNRYIVRQARVSSMQVGQGVDDGNHDHDD